MSSAKKHKICDASELEANSRVIAEVNGMEIAVFKANDEFFAIANYCPHAAGPLCEGELTRETVISEDGWQWEYSGEKKIINCPWHLWKFDVTTGRSVDNDQYAVPTYDVVVEDNVVYVVRG